MKSVGGSVQRPEELESASRAENEWGEPGESSESGRVSRVNSTE